MTNVRTVIVAAGVVVRGDKVLLTQRKADAHLAGRWEFPGGKVDAGEDPRVAVARELEEELGIAVEVGDVLEVTFFRYEEAAKCVLLLFYEADLRADSPEPRARDVAAFEWAGVDGLGPSRFPPADVDVLVKVRAKLDAARSA